MSRTEKSRTGRAWYSDSRSWIELWGDHVGGTRDGELALAGRYVDLRYGSTTSSTGQTGLRLAADGNVGIGTDTPTTPLAIQGNGGTSPVGITQNGGQGWGLEPSKEMVGVSRWLYPADQAVLVRGVAEELPFRDGTFDRVICQGALDHFVAPDTFMAEAARIIRPEGRVIIALTNYESLSCRAGRLLDRFAIDILRRPRPPDRPYYQPPPDHHHKGDLPFVRGLGGDGLSLVRCYGLSLLWLLRGRGKLSWGRLLDTAPEPAARLLLRALDRCAYPLPSQADMIVSVWRRRAA